MDFIANEYDDEVDSEMQHLQIEVVSPREVVNPREVLVNEDWPDAGVIDWRILQKLDFHKATRMIVDDLIENNVQDLLLYDLLPELLRTNQVSHISDRFFR